jgi:hypothetical protein
MSVPSPKRTTIDRTPSVPQAAVEPLRDSQPRPAATSPCDATVTSSPTRSRKVPCCGVAAEIHDAVRVALDLEHAGARRSRRGPGRDRRGDDRPSQTSPKPHDGRSA